MENLKKKSKELKNEIINVLTKKDLTDTTILEEFIVELKQIEGNMNNSAFVPSLRKDQVWIINEIIKMAEQKVLTTKNK
jgi:hypothetical protein